MELQKSFNFCLVRDPSNLLGELSWLPSTSVFLGLPVQSMGKLEEEQGGFSEEIQRVIQHV